MQTSIEAIETMIEPAVNAAGCTLYGCVFTQEFGQPTLAVLIEANNRPATVDDCSRVTHQIRAIVAVEAVSWFDQYNLEVSTPGIERKLFKPAHFSRYIGETVKLRTHTAIDNQRNFEGVLLAFSGDEITLEVNGIKQIFRLADIEQARLVAVF